MADRKPTAHVWAQKLGITTRRGEESYKAKVMGFNNQSERSRYYQSVIKGRSGRERQWKGIEESVRRGDVQEARRRETRLATDLADTLPPWAERYISRIAIPDPEEYDEEESEDEEE